MLEGWLRILAGIWEQLACNAAVESNEVLAGAPGVRQVVVGEAIASGIYL